MYGSENIFMVPGFSEPMSQNPSSTILTLVLDVDLRIFRGERCENLCRYKIQQCEKMRAFCAFNHLLAPQKNNNAF